MLSQKNPQQMNTTSSLLGQMNQGATSEMNALSNLDTVSSAPLSWEEKYKQLFNSDYYVAAQYRVMHFDQTWENLYKEALDNTIDWRFDDTMKLVFHSIIDNDLAKLKKLIEENHGLMQEFGWKVLRPLIGNFGFNMQMDFQRHSQFVYPAMKARSVIEIVGQANPEIRQYLFENMKPHWDQFLMKHAFQNNDHQDLCWRILFRLPIPERLLDPSICNLRLDYKMYPLHFASFAGNTDAVRALIPPLGVKLRHAFSDTQERPIHPASNFGYADIVSMLLKTKGVDIESLYYPGTFRVYNWAARYGQVSLMQEIEAYCKDHWKMETFPEKFVSECLDKLLINPTGNSVAESLHYLINKLTTKPSVEDGKRLFSLAVQYLNHQGVASLLEYDFVRASLPDLLLGTYKLPYHVLSGPDSYKLIEERSSDICNNYDGAARRIILDELFKHIHLTNKDGHTALTLAIDRAFTEESNQLIGDKGKSLLAQVQILLKAGVDPHVTVNGQTALGLFEQHAANFMPYDIPSDDMQTIRQTLQDAENALSYGLRR